MKLNIIKYGFYKIKKGVNFVSYSHKVVAIKQMDDIISIVERNAREKT